MSASVGGNGLLQKWLEEHVRDVAQTGSVDAAREAKEITDKVRTSLKAEFHNLTSILGRQESVEILQLCTQGREWSGSSVGAGRDYMGDLCKAIVELRYFTAGVQTERKKGRGLQDENAVITPLTDNDKAYARCVVGALALGDIYGDHCYLEDVVKEVSSAVEEKLKSHSRATGNLGRCKDIAPADLIVGRTVLGTAIGDWTRGQRAGSGTSPWRVRMLWSKRNNVCKDGGHKEEEKKKHYLEKNKGTVVSFSGLKENDSKDRIGGLDIADILTKPDLILREDTIEKALTTALSSGNTFDAEALTKTLNEETNKTLGLECLDKQNLCERAECVAGRWVENGKVQGGGSGATRTWDDLWKENDGLGKELKELSGNMINKNGEDEKHCKDLSSEEEKTVCKFIASGLKSIYEIKAKPNGGKSTKKDLEDQLFKRTMQCVLLNAFADKLEQLPCKDEKKVKEAVNAAFEKNDQIMKETAPCNSDGDKCFTCSRFNDYKDCTIKENGSSAGAEEELKKKIDPMFNSGGQEEMKKIQEEALRKICKPCEEETGNKCGRLECIVKKWEGRNKVSTGTATWEHMKTDFGNDLTKLLKHMEEKAQETDLTKHCNNSDWKDGDAHGFANKTACKLVTAGLHHISNIRHEYNPDPNNGDKNPYDNQEFKQIVSCLMLKAVVQKMKEDSKICDIDQGIRVGFLQASKIKGTYCQNGKPCIVCTWDGRTKDELDTCQIGSNATDKVKPNLDSLLQENQATVNDTLQDVLKTDQKDASLCQRLQCLASRVQLTQGKHNADDFWNRNTGEVATLWKELAKAMEDSNGNGGTECDQMDDNNRTPTNPEKTACNYLHAGLKALYNGSTTAATTSAPASSSTGTNILSQHPSFRQTMGCLLLHAYAKKMKEDSKCVIDSGIKKAFKAWNASITNGNCNGKGPCVPCQWNEDILESCKINTTGTGGTTTPTPVKEKLTQVQPQIGNDATTTLKKINDMSTLCDYIRCAGPKWFKNQMKGTGNPTMNWCNFWEEEGVKPTLLTMFQEIETKGKDNATNTNDVVCNDFGDGNEHSVERKACNHIAAGLKQISEVKGEANGSSHRNAQVDDKFFKQTMMCAALNLYATEIVNESNDKCPIDETKINEMFDKWNETYNNKSLCNGVGSGSNNVCFKCQREEKILDDCQLSVADALVATQSQSGTCDKSNADAIKVKEQMTKLLNEDNDQSQSNTNTIKSNITTTLSFITEMTSSFCTQLQCAAKKYYVKNNTGAKSSDVSWDALMDKIGKELTALLNNMNNAKKQSDAAKYCKDDNPPWSDKGHTERRTNRAACLHFASGLQHIYTHGNGRVNGPSFGQTMGCLFLKEYAKQLIDLADKEKKYKVHPDCSVDSGIEYAFSKSNAIMEGTPPCDKSSNSCFECKIDKDYNDCKIGNDKVGSEVNKLFEDPSNKNHMQQTLENTVCPILLTDILTPFLPLAPVSIGLSAMAYYLWKYFGPLGKGGPRFRRSPAEIPGSSVQEQVLDHVEEAGSHEYRLVKERKPRSVPTRTKRSDRANRRTIIEIHFEVLDECQKGDTQLNQKDFLELLVQEFMGSEFMEEEQVPKENVLMEGVPMESVPIKEVPSLGSGLMV
ncbi:SICAvar, type I [Plasmodium knowlesi strain H]|uniref:SICAvar, type I n=3 Tax=Plasmodium knowlesi TaxID=5850 RepID=A0A679L203_PLAKH|nr:SICAvar, type I [Plasmodium knowlesi strain H]OTN67861.1 SICAvar type I [Plasmodium knowlesi]CAA9990338.1 SICAvar, type I [Plasmodium knowlesi strain H]SBO22746.1 SICAvar, type I [Plasmodium knowlesi strain H]VVS79812.1 SICAvar, type I [Plasmodium knowlesi strain H]